MLFSKKIIRSLLFILLFWQSEIYGQEIIPYLQTPSDTSIWITWKTGEGTESKVFYGADSVDLNFSATGSFQKLTDDGYSGNYYYHSVQLTGLEALTYYYYRIKTGESVSKIYRFRAQPKIGSRDGHYRILVLGDHQVPDNDGYERLMKAARQKVSEKYGGAVQENINLILNDGDQVDLGTLWQYENIHFAKSVELSPNLPIMTAVGNHETYGSLGLNAYYPHFFYDKLTYKNIASPGGENYYAFQSGRILFVVLSSEHTTEEQINWVKQVVGVAKTDESVDWIISVAHRPIQAEQYIDDISPYIQNSIIPILTETTKSVLLITGHHHLYARGQLRWNPMYHIISGAASWDQFWGQSVEKDFDNVQKTIDYWAYQIIDFDLQNKKMEVESYAIGSPKLGFTLDNKLIDSFHRILGQPVPGKPSVLNEIPDTLNLPFTFKGSAFTTVSGEEQNSSWFQISTSEKFENPSTDKIRDFENLFGTTGAPGYLPVDIHKNININEYQVKNFELPNGKYFLRLRYRDKNTEWSEWSDTVSFVVKGSTEGIPEISTSKTWVNPNEGIEVFFRNGPNNPKDWIGIYKKGNTPGSQNSTDWKYVNASSGSVILKVTDVGEYFISFFINDGYTEITSRLQVYILSVPVLSMEKQAFNTGAPVNVMFQNAPSFNYDWIGIYRLNDIPGVVGSTLWKYVAGKSGNVVFSGLKQGYYFASYFLLDRYEEPGERVYFSMGENPANLTLAKNWVQTGETLLFTWGNGPGLANDWIGIYSADSLGNTLLLKDSLSVSGASTGNIKYDVNLEPGNYKTALFINGSSSAISAYKNFQVVKPTGTPTNKIDQPVKVYPSPTSGRFFVDFTGTHSSKGIIAVFDALGKQVQKPTFIQPGQFRVELDITGSGKGIYFVEIKSDSFKTVQKIVVE